MALEGDGAPRGDPEDAPCQSKEGFDLLEVAVFDKAPPGSRIPDVEVEH